MGSKGAIMSWFSTREWFQEGMPLQPLGQSLWKLFKRWVRFSSMLTLLGEFLQWLAYSHQWYLAAVYCPGTDTEKVGYGLYRGCPEVHLITEAPLCKNGPLSLID